MQCLYVLQLIVISGTYENRKYIFVEFSAQSNMISSTIVQDGYPDSGMMKLGSVVVYGVNAAPTTVTVNGQATTTFKYDATNKVCHQCKFFLNNCDSLH